MVISYSARSPAIHLVHIGNMVTGMNESKNVIVDQSTAARIQQPRTKLTDLSYAALDEKISTSTSVNQESPLSRPVKPKIGPTPM